MIEKAIREIINDPQKLDLLADEFRQGRDVDDLLALLNSDDEAIVGVGAWIAGEIRITPAKAQRVIARLHQLVNHENPSVRFHAVGALFPFLDISNPSEREILTRLSNDQNEGVRTIALAALTRMLRQ